MGRLNGGCSSEDGELASLSWGLVLRRTARISLWRCWRWLKSRRVKLFGLLRTSSLNREPSVVEPVHFYRANGQFLSSAGGVVVMSQTLYFFTILRNATTWALAKRDRACISSPTRSNSRSYLATRLCRFSISLVVGSSEHLVIHRSMVRDRASVRWSAKAC